MGVGSAAYEQWLNFYYSQIFLVGKMVGRIRPSKGFLLINNGLGEIRGGGGARPNIIFYPHEKSAKSL